MKTTSLALALTVSLAASAALARDEVKDAKPAKAPPAKTKAVAAKPAKPTPTAKANGKTELTGSYIKRDIHKAGLITDGPDQVLVIDNETIQNSGAADLRQLLVRRGIH